MTFWQGGWLYRVERRVLQRFLVRLNLISGRLQAEVRGAGKLIWTEGGKSLVFEGCATLLRTKKKRERERSLAALLSSWSYCLPRGLCTPQQSNDFSAGSCVMLSEAGNNCVHTSELFILFKFCLGECFGAALKQLKYLLCLWF